MSEQVLNGEARLGTGGIGRSIGALLAGFFVGAVFSLGTDLGLHAAGVAPALGQPMSEGLLLIATGYRTVYSVISSYVSARLAPDRPMGHALVGGAIGFAISFVGVVINWNHKLGPQWYPIALVLLAMPTAWAGGRLRELQIRRRVEN